MTKAGGVNYVAAQVDQLADGGFYLSGALGYVFLVLAGDALGFQSQTAFVMAFIVAAVLDVADVDKAYLDVFLGDAGGLAFALGAVALSLAFALTIGLAGVLLPRVIVAAGSQSEYGNHHHRAQKQS